MRLLIILSLFLSLTSCSVIKKTFQKNKSHVKTELQEKTKTEQQTITESTTKTVKEIDTVVVIPADSTEISLEIDSVDVDTVLQSDYGEISVSYKPKTGQLKVKAKSDEKKVPVKIREESTTHTRVQDTKKETTDLRIKQDEKTKEIVKQKEVKRLPAWIGISLVFGGAALIYWMLFGGGWLWLVKRLKGRKEPGKTG